MKHQKKNSNHLTPIILVLAVVVVVLIAVLAILMLRGGDEATVNESAQLPQLDVIPGELTPEDAPLQEAPWEVPVDVPVEPEVEPVAIETPYITLYYPGEWASVLQVEQIDGEIYTVKFSANLESGRIVPLFAIRLGGEIREGFACFMTQDGEMMAVSAESYEFVPEDGMRDSEIIIVFSMQEAMNQVLDGMNLFYTNVTMSESGGESQSQSGNDGAETGNTEDPGSLLPEDNGDAMSIDTPGGTLKYPTRWSDYLHTETVMEEPYSVSFYCRVDGQEDLYLFTVYIGGEEGMLAGSITGDDGESRDVRLDIEELALEDWAEEEAQIARAMQEDLNFVLEKLG